MRAQPIYEKEEYSLSCGHTILFNPSHAPAINEWVFCYKCSSSVRRVPGEGWRFKCRNCPYGRHVGEAPLTVSTRASAHAAKVQHVVDYWHTSKPTKIVTVGEGNDQLTLVDSPPY